MFRRDRVARDVHGVLRLDQPPGMTSCDAVTRSTSTWKRVYGRSGEFLGVAKFEAVSLRLQRLLSWVGPANGP